MEIVILVILFLVGTVASAVQAMRYLERRGRRPPQRHDKQPGGD